MLIILRNIICWIENRYRNELAFDYDYDGTWMIRNARKERKEASEGAREWSRKKGKKRKDLSRTDNVVKVNNEAKEREILIPRRESADRDDTI